MTDADILTTIRSRLVWWRGEVTAGRYPLKDHHALSVLLDDLDPDRIDRRKKAVCDLAADIDVANGWRVGAVPTAEAQKLAEALIAKGWKK